MIGSFIFNLTADHCNLGLRIAAESPQRKRASAAASEDKLQSTLLEESDSDPTVGQITAFVRDPLEFGTEKPWIRTFP